MTCLNESITKRVKSVSGLASMASKHDYGPKKLGMQGRDIRRA